MKRLFVIFCGLLCATASAGDKIGNGGGTWSCRISPLAPPTQLLLVDFFEAREQYGWTIRKAPPATSALAFVDIMMADLNRELPAYASIWKQLLERTLKAVHFVNAELEVVDDALYQIRPLNSSCAGGAWYYTQFANFNDLGQVLISKELWDSNLLTIEEKAGIIWHEVIYLWLRESYGDVNSVRARMITGLLFSTLTAQDKSERISKSLGAPLPNRQDWFCRSQNRLTNGVFGAFGASELEARASVLTTCQAGGYEFHCDSQATSCEKVVSEHVKWSCVAENGLNGRLYVGRGRIQQEALFRSQETCQAQVGKNQWLHCVANPPKCSEK